jgi:hypothetical protein
LECLDDDCDVDISRTWETIKENVKISVKESLDCYELKILSEIIRSKETSQITVVTKSKLNKWG